MGFDKFNNPLGEQIHVPQIEWLSTQIARRLYSDYSEESALFNYSQPIWSDEPHWTQFHAACWHALRNDDWTSMPFSPKRLAGPWQMQGPEQMSQKKFFSITSAYSALWDMISMGGLWRNPALTFIDWETQRGFNPEDFPKNFKDFWMPMLKDFANWYAVSGQGYAHYFPLSDEAKKFLFNFNEEREFDVNFHDQLDSLPQGGGDPFHISSHSGHPFEKSYESNISFRHQPAPFSGGWMEAPLYGVLTSETYSGWAHELMTMPLEGPSILRVDVRVHESMNQLTTLGHFFVQRDAAFGNHPDVNYVRYVNDHSLVCFLERGHFDYLHMGLH